MPIYTLQCKHCNKQEEIISPVVQRNKNKYCGVCKKKSMIRICDVSTFQLSGDCWAKDGYSKKGK